jgi:hypothetical protein
MLLINIQCNKRNILKLFIILAMTPLPQSLFDTLSLLLFIHSSLGIKIAAHSAAARKQCIKILLLFIFIHPLVT